MEQNKLIGIISYITVIGFIIALILNQEKKDPFSSFHIRQSLGIFVTGLGLSILAVVPIIGWIVAIVGSLVVLVMWILGLISAINGTMKPVPVLGEKFETWFQGI